MNARFPKQFSLRTMLIVVVIVAITIVVTRDYVRLQSARQHYGWLYASWLADRVTAENVVAGSFPLMDAEESTLWISKRTAEKRQAERLTDIVKRVRSPTSERSSAAVKHDTEYIIKRIRDIDPDAADELINSIAQEGRDPDTL